MLLRAEQLKPFQSGADEEFIRRLVMFLHKKYANVEVRLPNSTSTVAEMSLDLLHRIVHGGCARARGYGLSWENNLTTFVSLMLDVAPNFDEHPLIQRLLRDDRVPPDSRMDLVVENIPDETWEAAEQNYDPLAWDMKYSLGESTVAPTGQAGDRAFDDSSTMKCPKCAASVYVGTADKGEIILCDKCDTMMEIISLNPFMLNYLDNEPTARDEEPRVGWQDEWDAEGDDDAGDDKYDWGDEPGEEDDDDYDEAEEDDDLNDSDSDAEY